MAAVRVTVTLDERLVKRARRVGGNNFSGFIGDALERRVDEMDRQRIREALIARSIEGASEDLEMCREWAYVDAEIAARDEQ